MSEPQEIILSRSAFEAGDDEVFPFTVMGPTDEPVGEIHMKTVPMPVMDKYRNILNGIGRRNGNPKEAREYLFRKAFVKFEPKQPGAKLALNGHKSDLEFFIAETPKVVDRVVLAYHSRNYTDVQDT